MQRYSNCSHRHSPVKPEGNSGAQCPGSSPTVEESQTIGGVGKGERPQRDGSMGSNPRCRPVGRFDPLFPQRVCVGGDGPQAVGGQSPPDDGPQAVVPSSSSSKGIEYAIAPSATFAGGNAKTPACNTGVVSANLIAENRTSYGVDYLRFSCPKSRKLPVEVVQSLEWLKSCGEERRLQDYAGVDLAVHGRVVWRDTKDGRDVLVDLPGQACEYIRETLGVSMPEVIERLHKLGFHATRVDVAADSTDPLVSPDVVRKHLEAGAVTCRAKDYQVIQGKAPIGSKPKPGVGMTVYVGGRSSTRYMRVYDKSAEVAGKTGEVVEHTTRFELECKGEAAQKVAEQLEHFGETAIPGLLIGWIDFKPAKGRVEVKKRSTVAWWARITSGKAKIILQLKRGLSTPDKAKRWIDSQWGSTAALVNLYKPGYLDAVAAGAKVKPAKAEQWRSHFARGASDEVRD